MSKPRNNKTSGRPLRGSDSESAGGRELVERQGNVIFWVTLAAGVGILVVATVYALVL